jgi:hypothetical protein
MADTGGSHDYDDQRLIRYVLGTLNADETEALDELSMTDEDFAGRLRVVEDDLVDAYARGDLAADDRTRFESRCLSVPAARDRLRFAQTLAAHQQRTGSAASPQLGGMTQASRQGRPPLLWALAAAASIALAVASYVAVGRTRTPSPQPEGPSAVVKSQPSPPSAESPKASVPAQIDETVIAMVLMPPTRGPGESPTLTIPGSATNVQIHLVLESDDFRSYEVALKGSKTDRTLWRSARLQSSASGANRIVPVTIDAALLNPERYTLDLSGYRDKGSGEIITSYTFRVIR